MKLPKSVVTPLTYQLKLVLNLLHQTTKIQSPTYDKKACKSYILSCIGRSKHPTEIYPSFMPFLSGIKHTDPNFTSPSRINISNPSIYALS